MEQVQETSTKSVGSAVVRYWDWLAISAIFLLAFTIRAWTVRRGLPYVDHPDEPNPINYVLQMLRTGDLNPHFFQKPSLYVYLLLGVLGVHYRSGLASGLYPGLDQMTITTHQYTTIPEFFFWGRMLTVAIGSLTVLGVFALAKHVWGRGAGLIAALFIATSAFHVRHSQYVTTDVTSAWFVLLTFAATTMLVQGGKWRDYLIAGLCSGFAASTKYNAGVVALTIIAAHLLFWGRQALWRLPRLVSAGIGSLLGFLTGTPYALLSWPEFSRGIIGQWEDYDAGIHGDFVGAWNVGGYADFLWGNGLRPTACIAVVVGAVVLLRRRPMLGRLWLCFAGTYLLAHLAQTSHFSRNLMPLIVVCALPIGVAGAAAIAWLGQRAPRYQIIGGAALLVILLLPSILATARYTSRVQHGDTRVHALRWIEAHVPPGSRIVAEIQAQQGVPESRWATTAYLPQFDLAWYRQQGYAYIIASSDTWQQWAIPDEYVHFAGGPPLIEFGQDSAQETLGPHLAVYATGLSRADVPERPQKPVQLGGVHFVGITIGRPNAEMPHPGVEPTRQFKAGDVLGLRTFWEVEHPFDEDYFIFVHVLDAAGGIVAQRDAPPWHGVFPTSSWRTGTLVVDVNDVPLPQHLPAGDYTITIGMFNPENGTHPVVKVNGQNQAVGSVSMGLITIEE